MAVEWPEWMLYRTTTARRNDLSRAGQKLLRDVAREVLFAVDGINLLGPKQGVVWRGQADQGWRLESRAGRQGLRSAEMEKYEFEMITQARRIGADNAQHLGDWEILARLRHHGASTRLIDCTTDPFVALWFLCDDNSTVEGEPLRDRDGILLALQRAGLKEIDRSYERKHAEVLKQEKVSLLYTTPPIDPRIAAQRGIFVLHPNPSETWTHSELGLLTTPSQSWIGKASDQLDRLCGTESIAKQVGRMQAKYPMILGIVVPGQVKDILLDMLERNFGFTRASLFPDFSGMGEFYGSRRI